MSNRILTLLVFTLLTPLTASAACGFTRSGDTLTIVVGEGTRSCFSSAEFREAFKADVAAALDTSDDDNERRKPAFDQRNSRQQKLWNLAERRFQATMPSGRYFGQRR